MAAMAVAYRDGVPAFCLGAGTNLLVSDRGIRGLVVGSATASTHHSMTCKSCGCGGAIRRAGRKAVERGLEGLEFGEGIPGTVGGGLVMNAGAFGGEMARVVTSSTAYRRRRGARALRRRSRIRLSAHELPPRFVITRVDFELAQGDREKMRARVTELRAKRAARQPRGFPTRDRFSRIRPEISPAVCSRARASRVPVWAARRFRSSMRILSSISAARAPKRCAPDRDGAPRSETKRRRSRTRGEDGRRMVRSAIVAR